MATTVQQFRDLYPQQTDGVTDDVCSNVLTHASERVQAAILAPVDVSTHSTIIDLAVLHQAAAWLETGDGHEYAGWKPGTPLNLDGWQTVTPTTLAPRAARVLRQGGLLRPWGA